MRDVTQPTISMPKRFAPATRWLAMLWLVVAMVFQGFVIQTHAHIGAERSWATVAPTLTSGPSIDDRNQAPVVPTCLLCEEQALFGAYLLGESVAIAAPVATVYHYATASLPLVAPSMSSHAWQSRAPPLFTA